MHKDIPLQISDSAYCILPWSLCIHHVMFRRRALRCNHIEVYNIRYSLYGIRYTISSLPQTRFLSFHTTSLECRLWQRTHRTVYSKYRILLCDCTLRNITTPSNCGSHKQFTTELREFSFSTMCIMRGQRKKNNQRTLAQPLTSCQISCFT